MCKVGWQSATWFVEDSVNSADERIVTIIYIVLIRSPAVGYGSGVKSADLHHGDVLLEGDIGGVTAVVKPVRADDAQGVLVFLHIVYHGSTALDGSDIGSFEFLSS